MTSVSIANKQASEKPRPEGMRLFGHWLAQGWKLLWRAPLRLFGCMVLMFGIEAIIQLSVPMLGIPASKWIAGLLVGVLWISLDQFERSGRLQLIKAVRSVGGRWLALAGLSLVIMSAYLVQVICAYALLGSPAIDLLVFSEPKADLSLSKLQLGLILASAIPLATLLMFAAPLLLIDRHTLIQALQGSVKMVLRNGSAMILLALLMMALTFFAPVTYLMSVLLTGPWMLCIGLVAFKTLRDERQTQMIS